MCVATNQKTPKQIHGKKVHQRGLRSGSFRVLSMSDSIPVGRGISVTYQAIHGPHVMRTHDLNGQGESVTPYVPGPFIINHKSHITSLIGDL